MKILVINAGSSSIKYQLFNMDDRIVMASGVAERIGDDHSCLNHYSWPGQPGERNISQEQTISDHRSGLESIVKLLSDPKVGVIQNTSEIDGIGHRVVHGGEDFQDSIVIDEKVLAVIKANCALAPLHNPANLTGIEVARSIFHSVPQVAVFDTAFHQTIPPYAYRYALPQEYYSKYRIRRYGFHGTSHHYVAKIAAQFMNKPLKESNLITIHLGNGASITAIENGKSIDTSMGMTPLEGVIMGTRCGDVDPAIHAYLSRETGMSIQDIDDVMNKESGLKGICGTNDMRDILTKIDEGDESAQLAFKMYTYRIKKYIGAYVASLGNTDAIIFTGGIGQNSPHVRAAVCEKMQGLGIDLDLRKNKQSCNETTSLNTSESRVRILAIPTNEEFEIAQQTQEIISTSGK